MTLQWLSLCIVSGVLLAAVASDLRTRRIPNALVVYGALLGLSFQALAPAGSGLFSGTQAGLLAGMLGGAAGLALFLPLYVLRIMGAGDVKLVAMTGTWLGAQSVLNAVVWSLAAGGVLALAVALHSGVMRQVAGNVLRIARAAVVRGCTQGQLVQAPVQATGKLPYAVAIACGSALEMARLLLA